MTTGLYRLPRGSRDKYCVSIEDILASLRTRYMNRVRLNNDEEVDVVWWWPPEEGIITWIYGIPPNDDGSLLRAVHDLFETRGSDGLVPLPIKHIVISPGLDEIRIVPDERRRHEKRPMSN